MGSFCAKCYVAYGTKQPAADQLIEVYNQYQSFLGNMMVISTLILGFVMTGTLLTPSFNGEENYGAGKVAMFLKWTTLAGMCALFTLIISFLVHARGVDVYTRRGPGRATRAMRRVMLPTLIAECALYLSLLFFGYSVGHFIDMQYVGPEICPYDADGNEFARPKSFCGMLSSEFYDFSTTSCAAMPVSLSEATFLCSNLKTSWQDVTRSKLYYVWDMASDKQIDTFQRLSYAVSAGVCKADKAATRADQACVEPLDTPAKQQACASASMASNMASNCADQKIQDADKCKKVCGLTEDGRKPGPNLLEVSLTLKWVCLIVVILFAVMRLVSSCSVTMTYHYHEIKVYGFKNSIFNMLADETDLWKDTSGSVKGDVPAESLSGLVA